MEWKYVKPIKSADLIKDFEALVNYVFDDHFRRCVMNNNGGRPSKKAFDTDKSKERELKSFLSFNHEDKETVWKIFEWNKEELTDKFIPFAIDNFGNLICFDASNDHVVFINIENVTSEKIANSFAEFLELLYD